MSLVVINTFQWSLQECVLRIPIVLNEFDDITGCNKYFLVVLKGMRFKDSNCFNGCDDITVVINTFQWSLKECVLRIQIVLNEFDDITDCNKYFSFVPKRTCFKDSNVLMDVMTSQVVINTFQWSLKECVLRIPIVLYEANDITGCNKYFSVVFKLL